MRELAGLLVRLTIRVGLSAPTLSLQQHLHPCVTRASSIVTSFLEPEHTMLGRSDTL
jgi:hypothetical protein